MPPYGSPEKLIGSQQFFCLKEFEIGCWGEGGLRFLCEQDAMQSLRHLIVGFKARF
jgi:hypothetical protein